MDQKELEIVSIIAARKTEFYFAVRNKLIPSLMPIVEKDDARLRLRKVISELDNNLFISKQERDSQVIQPGLSVSKLNLDKQEIARQILEAMSK